MENSFSIGFSNSLPGGHSEVEPPDPISNSEVKRFSADGSVGSPHVRVGHCQVLIPKYPWIMFTGIFLSGYLVWLAASMLVLPSRPHCRTPSGFIQYFLASLRSSWPSGDNAIVAHRSCAWLQASHSRPFRSHLAPCTRGQSTIHL